MNLWGRYLLREIMPLYLAGLAGVLLLLLGGFMLELLADALSRGVAPGLIARYLLLKLPAAAVYGVPLALLFSALLGMTRLAQDSEIKAARLLGVGPGQFLWPLAALGLMVSAISFVNNEFVVPRAERLALEVERDILLTSPEAVLQQGSFFTDALGRSIYIERLLPGGSFEGVTVIKPATGRSPAEAIQAARGSYDQAAGVWELEDITFRVYRSSRLVLDFRAAEATLPVQGLAAATPRAQDLAFLPLGELRARIAAATSRSLAPEYTALHRKAAEPLAATAFALFALAVALFPFRRGVPLGIVSVMFLTFIYYATWSVFKLLGAQGTVAPWLGGWAPLLLYLGAALVLLAWSWRR